MHIKKTYIKSWFQLSNGDWINKDKFYLVRILSQYNGTFTIRAFFISERVDNYIDLELFSNRDDAKTYLDIFMGIYE